MDALAGEISGIWQLRAKGREERYEPWTIWKYGMRAFLSTGRRNVDRSGMFPINSSTTMKNL
jgi:hypothetical protein